MVIRWCVLSILAGFIVGCQSVDVIQHDQPAFGNVNDDHVNFWLSEQFDPESLECLAIYPTQPGDTHITPEELFQTHSILVSQIAPLNYRDVVVRQETSEPSNKSCKGKIVSTLREVSGMNLAIYSQKSRALEVQLLIDEQVVWKTQHRFVTRAGALPTDPLSLIVGLYQAQVNINDENVYTHNTKLVRRMVASLPDRSVINEVVNLNLTFDLDLMLEAGRYEEVIAELSSKEQLTRDELIGLARAYLGVDQNQAALDQYLNYILYDKASSKAWLGLAISKHRVGQLRHAFAAYEKALSLDNNNFVGHFQLGTLLKAINDPSNVSHFKQAGTIAVNHQHLALASRALLAIDQQGSLELTNEELRGLF